jgi:hypothetical protein
MTIKLKYIKTDDDIEREERDLHLNQTVRFVKYQEAFKFNIGDIVIMQYKCAGGWRTKTTTGTTDVPVKFMYVFENEVGIGYIKQLRVNGGGFTTLMTCVADINPEDTRLILDPELVDHLLLSDKGEEFDYSIAHAQKMAFRKEAVEKNKKLLLDLSTPEARVKWFYSLKKGDIVWAGRDWDSIINDPQEVTDIRDCDLLQISNTNSFVGTQEAKLIKQYRTIKLKGKDGWDREYNIMDVPGWKVVRSKPYSLKESDSI